MKVININFRVGWKNCKLNSTRNWCFPKNFSAPSIHPVNSVPEKSGSSTFLIHMPSIFGNNVLFKDLVGTNQLLET